MSYIGRTALPGEQVIFRSYLHPIVFASQILTYLVCCAIAYVITGAIGGIVFAFLLLPGFTIPLLRVQTSEFAVTNRRVVLKTGIIRRRTIEVMLPRVEAVEVVQTVLGRLLGYGTITVIGSGGTRERFTSLTRPLEFRRQVEGQVFALTTPRP